MSSTISRFQGSHHKILIEWLFIKEVPLTIGTKTEDTILEALKEGEIEMLDSVCKRVKKQSIIVQVARKSQNLRGYGSGFQGHWPRISQI